MLSELTVENYALIESLRLDFSRSLNIITGETGAGKSILLGALGLLLGNRADASVIMDRDRNCVVEGVFDVSGYGLEPLFEEHDVDHDPQTVIRRIISPQGKSRAYVNDIPVQLGFLRELGSYLIDIHSQNQTLRIADERFRLQVVDGMAGHDRLVSEYTASYGQWRRAVADLEKLRSEAERAAADEAWLTHQVGELEAAAFTEGEQERLEAELDELAHAEEIKRVLSDCSETLSREESGVIVELKSVVSALAKSKAFYPRAGEYELRLHGVVEELKDLERELAADADRIESDPGALAKVEERIALMYSLFQKHKASDLGELLAVQRDYRARLDAIVHSSENIGTLESEVERLEKQARAVAGRITEGRKKAAGSIAREAAGMMASLGLPDSVFRVEIVPAQQGLRPTGADEVRFLFSANAGVEPSPVEKVASGGEMSRLMLVLKSIAARSRKLPSIIFDEIDSGVSGRIADAMGGIIDGLSGTMQVVNITHLPQVAAKGDCHLFVYKTVSGGRTRTALRRLTREERIREIAGMLSGRTVTEAAERQARELLGI
ncbi:MAG: DNA repair protein RecN [Alistipes sp.]|nr:DNA repair protein RecN [Alistipes sp.]